MTETNTTEPLALVPSSPCNSLSQQNPDTLPPTSTSNSESPVLKLPDDLLWRIFWINADLEDEVPEDDREKVIPALDTLRHSSQVCSNWRRLILSSSSLWGQSINITSLGLGQQDWREEVLRRTDQSPLDISGGSQISKYEAIAIDIVDRYWDRIRFLDLDFAGANSEDGRRGERLWEIFRRPSEVLETFRVTLLALEHLNPNRIHSPILNDPNFVIFENRAPALHAFYAPNISFSLDAPWLTHLHYLSLNTPVSAYDLLQAIARMPLLECLADEDSNAITHRGNAAAPLPQITAPSIDQILIASYLDMRPYMEFLAHIKPAARCSLAFTYHGSMPDVETLVSASRILSTYSRCCDLSTAIDITLTLFRHRFEFEAQIPSTGPFCFDLDFTNQARDLPPDMVDTLFKTLPPHNYPNILTLSLTISPFTIQPSNPRITEFILAVTSVEILFALPVTLSFLLALPPDILAVSFPLLQKVGLSYCPRTTEIPTIKAFLTSRISMAKPLLTLSVVINRYDRTDMRDLEEFTGLKIILEYLSGEEKEHICGDGDVQDLLIGSRDQVSQTDI